MLPTHPQKLLFLDACGAGMTALGMAFVVAPLDEFFGLPRLVAYALAGVGVLLAVFSLINASRDLEDHRRPLGWIARANLSYCLVSVVLMALHRHHLTPLGWLYLSGEILIIVFLARYELFVASNDDEKDSREG